MSFKQNIIRLTVILIILPFLYNCKYIHNSELNFKSESNIRYLIGNELPIVIHDNQSTVLNNELDYNYKTRIVEEIALKKRILDKLNNTFRPCYYGLGQWLFYHKSSSFNFINQKTVIVKIENNGIQSYWSISRKSNNKNDIILRKLIFKKSNVDEREYWSFRNMGCYFSNAFGEEYKILIESKELLRNDDIFFDTNAPFNKVIYVFNGIIIWFFLFVIMVIIINYGYPDFMIMAGLMDESKRNIMRKKAFYRSIIMLISLTLIFSIIYIFNLTQFM